MTDSGSTPLFKFQSQSGFFGPQASMTADDGGRRETHEFFGLLPRFYPDEDDSKEDPSPSWQRFAEHVKRLNRDAPNGVSYKVLFVTRHGQGIHNVMETKVGTAAWESHWALLDGDGTVVWADADLTETGEQQARDNGKIWRRLMEENNMPFPSLYTSPHQRCLKTARLVFEDLAKTYGKDFRPIVKEFLRERTGRHTCDRRSTRTWIAEHYPDYLIEPGFSEQDQVFKPDARETEENVLARQQAVLSDIFANEAEFFVSFTMHSLAARFLMRAFGHEEVRLAPATTIAFLVKAEEVWESPKTSTK
ncbi:histidine phosphatase superfamily [Xylariales sp. AK1849]|nr:histidine phosphatase superfamily [Xylariales sp. AK1849]